MKSPEVIITSQVLEKKELKLSHNYQQSGTDFTDIRPWIVKK